MSAPDFWNAPELWNDSGDGHFLWSNTNVGEAMPDVLTPASWSTAELFLNDVMATSSIPPDAGFGRIGGRVYLNLSVLATLVHAFGLGERQFRWLIEEAFGRVPDDITIPLVTRNRFRSLRAGAPVIAHTLRSAARHAWPQRNYLAEHPTLCRRRRGEIGRIDDPAQLARRWATTYLPEFHRICALLSAVTRSTGAASFLTSRDRLVALLDEPAASALTAGVASRSGGLASLGLLEGLDGLARGEIDAGTFNQTYGHRGPHEFELAVPRAAEDPAWLTSQRDSARGFSDQLARQDEAQQEAWSRLRSTHPLQARAIGHQLAAWARLAHEREWARSEVVRYLWVVRAWVCRAGELTRLGEDAFLLAVGEVADALAGRSADPDELAERRRAYDGYRALPAYPALILGRFDPYAWAADPQRRTDRYVEDGAGPPASEEVSGFPGAAGVVVGRARLLTDPSQHLDAGEVLVAATTNVGWTPLFPRAAAVVTDVGAPLSHAAIVARELGIPAVVGTGNATMQVRTGDLVRVDGAAGTVRVLGRG